MTPPRAQVGGTNVPGSPFVLNVYPGAASAANSNVRVVPGGVLTSRC